MPAVQDYLTGLAEEKASEQLNTKVSLGGIDIDFLEEIVLEDLYVEDQQGDTLLYSGRFSVSFDIWPLTSKTISINQVIIRNTYINLYQLPGSDSLNFEFIPEALSSADTTQQQPADTTSSSWNVQANQLLLSDIRFDYDADSTQMQLALNQLNLLFDKIDLEEELISASELEVDELAFSMRLPATSEPADTTSQEADTTDSNVINPSGYTFRLDLLQIADSRIAYQVGPVPEQDTVQQMDFENLLLTDITTQAEDIYVGATELSLDLPLLTFREANSGFALNDFAARYSMDMPALEVNVEELRTNHSELNGNIRYGMKLVDNTAEMMESITLESQLDEAIIGMQDASYFTDALAAYPTLQELQPRLSWQVDVANGQGTIDALNFEVPEQASLVAEASFRDLAALDTTIAGSPYFNLELQEMNLDYAFLSKLLDDSTAQYLSNIPPQQLSVTASAEGRLDDLQAQATLETGLGQLIANGNYQQTAENAVISADMQARRFDVSAIMLALGNPDSVARQYGNLSMKADLNMVQDYGPADTSISRLDADVLVENFGYMGYQYEGLVLKAEKRQDQVEALIDYEDSLLQLHAEAQALLEGINSTYQLDMQLNEADLYKLGLVEDSIRIENVAISAEATGNNIDNINGRLKLDSIVLVKQYEQYVVDSMLLIAQNTDTSKTFRFESDRIMAEVSGQFEVAQLPQALENLRQYYLTAYESPPEGEDTIRLQGPPQELYFQLEIRETPKLAEAFVPELKITETIKASLYFNSKRRKLTSRVYLPRVMYGTNMVDSLLFTAQTSRKAIRFNVKSDYTNVAGLTIPEWQISGNLSGVSSDSLKSSPNRLVATDVDFNLKIGAEGAPYRVDLNAILTSSPDSLIVRLDSSELVLEEEPWQISSEARLLYAQNYLKIEDFFIQQDEQRLTISTDNQDGNTNLQLLIEQLALGPLLNSLDLEDIDISGRLNVDSKLTDLFGSGDLQAEVGIDTLEVQELPVGNFALNVKGDQLLGAENGGSIDMEMELDGASNEFMAQAQYLLDSGYIDANIDMERFQLDPWQTFMTEYVDQLEGVLKADLRIQGTTDDPEISGGLTFAEEVTIMPSLTSAVYYIDDQRIDFEGERMVFNEFTILDSARTPATLDGNIKFSELSNPVMSLDFDTDDFLFVNSEEFENESFYGRAFATASLYIEGEADDISVSGDASINEGTDMTIALISEAEDASKADWVRFIDKNLYTDEDTLQIEGNVTDSLQAVQEDTAAITGLSLNTAINISPDAELTIVLDPENGDRITAKGDAELQVSMDPGGDVNIQGTYLLESGKYVLTFMQVIQKEFNIQEGSTLVWAGDPTNAQFDITATYTAQTTLDELLGPFRDNLQESQLEAVSTRQDVNVVMNISGQFTEPEISFDIDVPALGGASADIQQIQTIIDRITRDQTSLYKQVFGLIVLNRFLPPDGGFGGGGGGGAGYTAANQQINESVSQLLSGVLNELSEQYLGGIQISLGLESNEIQAQNTALADRDLDVQLSKTFFDNRLTVRVGGMTSINTNDAQSTTAAAGVADDNQFYGEFEVLYRIDARGNLNIRIFQESDRNVFTNEVQQEQGVSLSYQRSFDEFFGDDEILKSDYPGVYGEEEEDNEEPEEEKEDSEEESETRENDALDNAQRKRRLFRKP
ncbi:MAG: translocation/assembly module TamB domain-containing protein [Cyclobacteriaceae bacterium]